MAESTKSKGKQKEAENSQTEKPDSPFQQFRETSDILLMLYPKDKAGNFSESIQSDDETTIYNLLAEQQIKKENLLLMLDTSGGNVYSAVKIMDCLRSHYTTITIAIPQSAKSSGTMMCFGADKLIMSSISELGPLDKPLRHPDNENTYISALDIVRSLDGTIDTAISREKEMAISLRGEFGMRIRSCLEISNDYMAKIFSPMLQHEDIKIYNQAKRLLAIAETYGSELLKKHMFNYIKTDKIKKAVVDKVISQFVWLYPDHAFAVRRDELRDWFFIVEDAESISYWNELWSEFKKNLYNKNKVIRFMA